MLTHQLLLIVGFLSMQNLMCLAKVFNVAPTVPANQPCPLPCQTLDQYAQNASQFAAHTNISLVFLEGVHNLSHRLDIIDVDQMILLSLEKGTVIIDVKEANIFLQASTCIHISDITIRGKFLTGDASNSVLNLIDAKNITFVRLEFDRMSILMYMVKGLAAIRECSTNDSQIVIQLIDTAIVSIVDTRLSGLDYGNFAGMYITNHTLSPTLKNFTLSIKNSSVSHFSYGIVLNFLPFRGRIEIAITNTQFVSNVVAGLQVGNFSNSEVSIENCTIANSSIGAIFLGVKSISIVDSHIIENEQGITSIDSGLVVENTMFQGNMFGVAIPALELYQGKSAATENITALIKNCTFTSNSLFGVALVNTPRGTVLRTCTFDGNQGTPVVAYQSTIELRGENIFRDNTAERGAGMALFNSTVTFGPESNTTFINNTAREFGGAIYIANLPPFFPQFLIAVENSRTNLLVRPLVATNELLKQNCFYKSNNATQVTFANNSAKLGGIDIYGATVYSEDCSIKDNKIFSFDEESVPITFLISSNPARVCFCINNEPQCENKTYIILKKEKFPGESFNISVALAGYNFGRVAGSVYTNVLGQGIDYKDVIDYTQCIQATEFNKCSNLTFSVSSPTKAMSSSIILTLTPQEQFTQKPIDEEIKQRLAEIDSDRCRSDNMPPCTALLTTPVYINVTLDHCPMGFKLNETSRACDCDEILTRIKNNDRTVLTCKMRDGIGYINREGTVWVGVDSDTLSEKNNDIYYWHRYCPRDYCNSSQISIDPKVPDKQCSSNRAGILCGRCRKGYSLELGGNKCIISEYSGSYVVFLIIFAILGIVLVVLIKLLDLTVSNGTINGLIFYANVVWRNNAILFPMQDRLSIGYYIITVPIAWINLNFGIETYFSDNLDQLTKTGLQFVFPVYIWCIVGLIIVISHYSTRATRLFGNNAVSVLATLFLLSYGKIFKNITNVFTFADVADSNGTTHRVWTLDGNIPYGGTAGHIFLMVVALLFLILFLLPFTLTLLLVPFLRAKSHLRPLHWINTLKPFFDAYYGPFKDKKQHQVWTGILLMSRVIILIVYTLTCNYNPNANMLVLTIIAILLQTYSVLTGLPYKKLYLSVLEILYLLNLSILGGTFLFYQTLPQEDRRHDPLSPVAAASVCIALIQFIFTILYTVKQIISKRIRSKGYEDISTKGDSEAAVSGKNARKHTVTTQDIEITNSNRVQHDNFSAVRETLLA